MTVFMTSCPCVIGADRVILNPENGFLEKLKQALPGHPRALFVCGDPADHQGTDDFGRDYAAAFAEAGIPLRGYSVLDGRNEADTQLLIWQSDLIVLSGGHVPTQNLFFQKIGLKKLIHNFQGVVLGISAGSMNCARRVYAQPEAPGESRADFRRFYPGLGLSEINILPHYQQVKDSMLDGKKLYADVTLADSVGESFLSLVDGSYITEAKGETTLYGEAYAVTDGKMIQISDPGDVVPLG
ncbi:MAG: Type 1 glutamine amidotransferase-like domain-containing protein [Oscillospiraceae bacterium]|nr:Type 1 glutamine amidotransferase-like domain-containing protein [Oscillospiraceae bacterium]